MDQRAHLTLLAEEPEPGDKPAPDDKPDAPDVGPGNTFRDMGENDWYAEAVTFVYQRGLFKGVETDRFAPVTVTPGR